MVGALLFALGTWDLRRDPERGVRLLALGSAFAYNRLLPSLDWEPVAARAEDRLPGRLDEQRAAYAGLLSAGLRDEAARLVAETG